jgi:hypothetical protein
MKLSVYAFFYEFIACRIRRMLAKQRASHRSRNGARFVRLSAAVSWDVADRPGMMCWHSVYTQDKQFC